MMLFADFSASTKTQWIAQVTKELKGAAIDSTIFWEFEPNTPQPALLFRDETQDLAYLQILNKPNEQNGLTGRIWHNLLSIKVLDEKVANQKALAVLNQGVEAICFDVNEHTNLAVLLDKILLPYCTISFQVQGRASRFLSHYRKYIETQGYDRNSLTGSIIGTEKEVFLQTHFPLLRTLLVESNPQLPHSEQLAKILLQTSELIRNYQKNFDKSAIFSQLQFEVKMDNLYFVNIAKLRALRLLLTQLTWSEGVEDFSPSQVSIHAITTLQGNKEPNNYLISNTIQAMAAVIGGCNLLTVTPHTIEPQEFSERIARNVSNLLREEAYLDKVADAAAGSYYIDKLTDTLAEKAWNLYRNV